MKGWQYIISALLLIMVSCQKSVPYDPLADDSHGFANDSVLVSTHGFYDSVFVDANSSLTQNDLAFQRAKIYYYKAVIEENDPNQHVEAFSDYLNALWVMDGLTQKRRIFSISSVNPEYEHFTALIYDRLAWFFYTYDAWDMALECLENSNVCFEKEDNQKGIAANYDLMGDVMLAQSNKKAASDYYKKSDAIHERLGSDNVYQHFNNLFHRALDLYNAGESHASYDLLHHALEMTTDDDMLKRKLHFSLGYNCEKSNIYKMFKRKSIDLAQLIKVSNALDHNFLRDCYEEV